MALLFKVGKPGVTLIYMDGQEVGAINQVGDRARYDIVLYSPRRELTVTNGHEARVEAKNALLHPSTIAPGRWRDIAEHQPRVQPAIKLRNGWTIEAYDRQQAEREEREFWEGK